MLEMQNIKAVQDLQFISDENTAWPEPEKIVHTLLPVPPLPLEIIPKPMHDWISDITYRMQCPPDAAAVAAIVMIGSVIGTGCGIRPKQKDDWLVVPNLYGAIVGRPGILMKSPTLAEIMKPLVQLEAEAKRTFDDNHLSYEVEQEILKAQREELKGKIKKATSKNPTDINSLKEQYLMLHSTSKPVWRRYRSNNATIEKLSELLNDSPRGLLVLCDELTGLLDSWGKNGHEQDRSFFLEAWNGTSDHYTDRIGRGTTYTKNMCVSIFGGIQPTKLQQYLYSNRFTDDGMFQRFQLLVYPDEPKNWKLIDQTPDARANNCVFKVIETLANMDFAKECKVVQEEDSKIPYFRFTDEAQETFNTWLTELEINKIRSKEDSVMVEHLVKYRKLMPSLALIFHLIDVADGKANGAVSLKSTECAAAWCDYLESHARRIYNLGNSVAIQAAESLARRIARGEIEDTFTVRTIYRNKWSNLCDKEIVQTACDILVEKGWLKEKVTLAGFQQRSKIEYIINPKTRGFYG
jgi:hypothetical protein